MSLDLLDTPVRLTWDLHGPGAALSAAELLAVAERIVDGGVFFVTLEESPLVHPAIAALLGRLGNGGCQLQLVCSGEDAELAALETLPAPLPAVQLDVAGLLDAGTVDEPRLQITLAQLRRCGVEPALRLTPLRSNLHMVPALLRLARGHGVSRFKLPNARIGDSFRGYAPAALPTWQDLEQFRALWLATAPPAAELPALEIHDRFLWEIMTPDDAQARSEYGGCQAANSLGHIDAAGILYPCAAWPLPLGSLLTHSLDALWQTVPRLAVRARVADAPAGCRDCRDYPLCLGGCRGLATVLNGAAGERDLMCRAPR